MTGTFGLGMDGAENETSRGSPSVKILPLPSVDVTVTVPFMASASRREIESPSPVPPNERPIAELACVNGWKSLPRPSAENHVTDRLTSVAG